MIKKFLLLLLPLLCALSSCSNESEIEETATNYVKSQMLNSNSFKLESIEIRKDTVPFYLNNELLSMGKEVVNTLHRQTILEGYGDPDLWSEEISNARAKFVSSRNALKSMYASAEKKQPIVAYLVYMKYAGTNEKGATVSNKRIIIVDKDNPKNVLGDYAIDDNFELQLYAVLELCDSKFELKQNQFGKYELGNKPFIYQFIFGD